MYLQSAVYVQKARTFWRKAEQGHDRLLIVLLLLFMLLVFIMLWQTMEFVAAASEEVSVDLQVLLGMWFLVGMLSAVCAGNKLAEVIVEVSERE